MQVIQKVFQAGKSSRSLFVVQIINVLGMFHIWSQKKKVVVGQIRMSGARFVAFTSMDS